MKIGCGSLIPDNSTTDPLKYICVSTNFINPWIKSLELIYVWNFQSYSDNINETFNKIPTTTPVKNYQYFKGKWQLLLAEI